MRALCLAMVLAVWACGSAATVATGSPSAATSTRFAHDGSPRPASGGHYAVVTQGTTRIEIVNVARGTVAATAGLVPELRPDPRLPGMSLSLDRIYYLNGTSELDWLAADGSRGVATNIAIGANQQAGFAISPDDTRLAVSVFTFTPPDANGHQAFAGMRLYVEDVLGGGHHVDIFSSTSVAEYPIGWTAGHLVLAVIPVACCSAQPLNPYFANSYHVVDPDTGRRLASLCGGGSVPLGPVVAAGAICGPGNPIIERWDGSTYPAPVPVPDAGDAGVALSPDGTHVMVGGTPIRVLGNPAEVRFGIDGWAIAWVDLTHLVVRQRSDGSLWLLDLRKGVGAQMPGASGYIGALPAAIS